MDQTKKPASPTAEERNEKVRAVLLTATSPLGPTEIGRRIGEPWSCYSGYGLSAAITPVCRRIGAIGEKGKWSLKADGA
jgi:hypothetical protein